MSPLQTCLVSAPRNSVLAKPSLPVRKSFHGVAVYFESGLKNTRPLRENPLRRQTWKREAMAVREEQWLQTIAAAKQSGQPIKVWCAEHGVPLSSFYKWQRKMRDSLLTAQNSEIQFQELEVPQNICGTATSDRILLHIQDILVELPAGVSAEQISAVIRGIRHAG